MATSSARRAGRCVNIGNCSLADDRTPIEVAPGSDFICPECTKPLVLLPDGGRRGTGVSLRPLLIMAGVAVLIGLVAFLSFKLLHRPDGDNPRLPDPSSDTALLRLGGSNTIGDKLGPALAEGWLKTLGCEDVKTTSPAKDETALSCEADGKTLSVTVAAHGTETGFAGLKSGAIDLAMASDRIDDKAVADLSALGNMKSLAAEHVIGFDGVAVIVNPGNTVQQLTLAQAAGLFSGEVSEWSEVGGTPGPVQVYIRDTNSGTRKFFDRVVLKANGKTFSPAAHPFEKGTDLADAVAADPGGIGFVGANSAEVAKAIPIQATEGGTPLSPTTLNVRTLDYALSRSLYLYAPPNRTNPRIAQFLAFVDSSAGQDIVRKSGFTPLTIIPIPEPLPPNSPPGYADATANAKRLTFNFNFETNSSDLDNLGLTDLKRLADYLSKGNIEPSHIMLIGFTDDQGAVDYNIQLSIRRAETVAAELRRGGVAVGTAIGFGQALPIASNMTEEGRNHNRRVEIWVKQ